MYWWLYMHVHEYDCIVHTDSTLYYYISHNIWLGSCMTYSYPDRQTNWFNLSCFLKVSSGQGCGMVWLRLKMKIKRHFFQLGKNSEPVDCGITWCNLFLDNTIKNVSNLGIFQPASFEYSRVFLVLQCLNVCDMSGSGRDLPETQNCRFLTLCRESPNPLPMATFLSTAAIPSSCFRVRGRMDLRRNCCRWRFQPSTSGFTTQSDGFWHISIHTLGPGGKLSAPRNIHWTFNLNLDLET